MLLLENEHRFSEQIADIRQQSNALLDRLDGEFSDAPTGEKEIATALAQLTQAVLTLAHIQLYQ